VADGN